VTGALDLLLGSEKGNSSRIEATIGKLEAVYLLECVAPAGLHVDRFLPPTPIHVLVDGDDVEEMLETAREQAQAQTSKLVAQAQQEMSAQLSAEINRLKELKKINPSVRPEEIVLLIEERRVLGEHLSAARLRLDALRLA
jgi:ATP-dependent helicase HepA